MKLEQVLHEIRGLNLYLPGQWEEYLDCFEDAAGLRARLARRPDAGPGEIVRRIARGKGRTVGAGWSAVSPKIATPDSLPPPDWRQGPLGVVSGSFDLLHLGHVRRMRYAKESLAGPPPGVLAALVLTDQEIQFKKGVARPVLGLDERLEMIAAVRFVDYAVPLERPDCLEALRRLKPQWFFKTKADLSQEAVRREIELVTSLGGQVRFFPDVHDDSPSTTSLIQTIQTRWNPS